MIKTKLIVSSEANFENDINSFILDTRAITKDFRLIDIKYHNFVIKEDHIYLQYSALIIYSYLGELNEE